MLLANTGAAQLVYGPVVFDFSCNFDATKFPFDTQTCSMEFTSIRYKLPTVKYLLAPQSVVLFAYSGMVKQNGNSEFEAYEGYAVRNSFSLVLMSLIFSLRAKKLLLR